MEVAVHLAPSKNTFRKFRAKRFCNLENEKLVLFVPVKFLYTYLKLIIVLFFRFIKIKLGTKNVQILNQNSIIF